MKVSRRTITALWVGALVAGGAIGAGLVHTAPATVDPPAAATAVSACSTKAYNRTADFGSEPTASTRAAVAAHQQNVDGTITDPYTGLTQTGTAGLDADHVFPLEDAWARGANCWPAAERAAFARDVHFLVLVSAHLNRSKGALTLDVWQPPVDPCGYAHRYMDALAFWRFVPTPAEDAEFSKVCAP